MISLDLRSLAGMLFGWEITKKNSAKAGNRRSKVTRSVGPTDRDECVFTMSDDERSQK